MYTSVFVLTTRHGDGLYASLSFFTYVFPHFPSSSCHRLICASLFAAVQMMRIIAFKLLSTLCHPCFHFCNQRFQMFDHIRQTAAFSAAVRASAENRSDPCVLMD